MKLLCCATLSLALMAPSVHALDRCLVGLWQADNDDLARVLSNSGMPGTAEVLSGRATLRIDPDEIVQMRVDDLTIEVTVDGIPPTQATMTGYNLGDISTIDDGFIIQIEEFTIISQVDVMGERMTIPLDETTAPLGHAAGGYSCSDDQVIFDVLDSADGVVRMPRLWTRID